ncbi:MAG TPA: translation initiation factor, partial [Lentisphaeria bacterium]|nr:translation initiation factor [Lentisphaeria bacterium]
EPNAASAPKSPILTLAVERKGRGGKTVTIVRGLKGLDTATLMTIGAEIKTALGIGARFADAVLELQGDQRQRAAAWFENKNFSCRILP